MIVFQPHFKQVSFILREMGDTEKVKGKGQGKHDG
jgi:hypothetical protein